MVCAQSLAILLTLLWLFEFLTGVTFKVLFRFQIPQILYNTEIKI